MFEKCPAQPGGRLGSEPVEVDLLDCLNVHKNILKKTNQNVYIKGTRMCSYMKNRRHFSVRKITSSFVC